MKKAIFQFTIPVSVLLLFVLLVSYDRKSSTPENDGVPVGTVIYSVLPPEVFLNSNKDWARLDGASMRQDWELNQILRESGSTVLNGRLPDASGMFLRAMNYDNKGADPSTSRRLGELQGDMIEEHRHTLNISGKTDPDTHSHGISTKDDVLRYDHSSVLCENCARESGGSNRYFTVISSERIENRGAYNKTNENTHSHSFSFKDSTGITTERYTGTETRPVNIALYVYVKVN